MFFHALRTSVIAALLIACSISDARADEVELFTPLGQVQLDGISAESNSGRSLSCLTTYTFGAAADLLKDLELTGSETSVPKIWQIHLRDRFASLEFVLRSGESALFHTALMNPPAEIFIELSNFYEKGSDTQLPQEIRSRCPGWSKELVSTLGHEIAHGIEFALMGKGSVRRLRWHEEGFAMWFEEKLRQRLFADDSPSVGLSVDPQVIYSFSGTKRNYDEVSRIFEVLSELLGQEGVKSVYQLMFAQNLSFADALKASSGLSPSTIIWLSNELTRNTLLH